MTGDIPDDMLLHVGSQDTRAALPAASMLVFAQTDRWDGRTSYVWGPPGPSTWTWRVRASPTAVNAPWRKWTTRCLHIRVGDDFAMAAFGVWGRKNNVHVKYGGLITLCAANRGWAKYWANIYWDKKIEKFAYGNYYYVLLIRFFFVYKDAFENYLLINMIWWVFFTISKSVVKYCAALRFEVFFFLN